MVTEVPDSMDRVPPVKVPWLVGLTNLPLKFMVPDEGTMAPLTVPVVETTVVGKNPANPGVNQVPANQTGSIRTTLP